MKNLILILVFALFGQVVFAQSKNIAQVLPEDTRILVKVQSLDDSFEALGLNEKLFFGQSLENARKQVVKQLGVDILNLQSLKKLGVDTAGSAGMSMGGFEGMSEGNVPRFYVAFFIPVKNQGKAVADFKKLVTSKKPKLKFGIEENLNYFQDYNNKMYFFGHAGYLFLVMSKGMEVPAVVEAMKSSKNLAGVKKYQEITAKIKTDEDFYFYVDLSVMFNVLWQEISRSLYGSDQQMFKKTLDTLKDYETMAVNMSFKNKDLSLKTAMVIKEGSELLAMMGELPVKRELVLSPAENLGFLFSATFDFIQYLAFVEKIYPEEITKEINIALDEFKLKYGIDVKQDILANLDGNMNLAVYDAKTINMFNYNTVFALGVKDVAKMKSVLDALYAKIPAEQKTMVAKEGETYLYTVFGMVQITLGVKNQTLLIASSKPLFNKFPGKGASFINKIKDANLAATLKSKIPFVFYINLEEVYTALKNFMAMSGSQRAKGQKADPVEENIKKFFPQFEYLLITGDWKGTLGTAEFVVKTKFKAPFFKALSELIGK